MRRTRAVVMIGAAALAAAVAALERTAAGRRLSRRLARQVARTARYESGRLEGVRYRMAGRTPDPRVTGGVLADRVRSELGPLEHRLDVPRVLVTATGHDVMLHGDVGTQEQAERIVDAVGGVPGVEHVDSRLHVGYFAGDTRPSDALGHAPQSAGMRRLLAAAHGGGAVEGRERATVRAVLCTFLGTLPPGERRHVAGHLPADLRGLVDEEPAVVHAPLRRLDDFAVAALPTLAPETRRSVVESVLGALRELVPEEDLDIAAVLPEELRHAWKTAIPL